MCNGRKESDSKLVSATEPAAPPSDSTVVPLTDEQRARLAELIEKTKPRLIAIAKRYLGKKDNRRRRGSADDHEELRDFMNEGLLRVMDDDPDIYSEADLLETFKKKLDNRDRSERRSEKSKAIKVDVESSNLAEDETVVPWRARSGRADHAAELQSDRELVTERLAQDSPHLSALFGLYLAEVWTATDEAKALSLPVTKIYQMRRELALTLNRIVRDIRRGDK